MTQVSLRDATQTSRTQRGPQDHEKLTMQGQIRQRAYDCTKSAAVAMDITWRTGFKRSRKSVTRSAWGRPLN